MSNKHAPLLKEGETIGNTWRIGRIVGRGTYSEVYEGYHIRSNVVCALKIDRVQNSSAASEREYHILSRLQKYPYFPRIYGIYDVDDQTNTLTGGIVKTKVIAMQLLGRSISKVRDSQRNGRLPYGAVLALVYRMLIILECVHSEGYLHRDVKPSNFVLGNSADNAYSLFLIDFGLARSYSKPETYLPTDPRPAAGFRGTSLFSSLSTHANMELDRADDLWSLFYVFLDLAYGGVCWRSIGGKRRECGVVKAMFMQRPELLLDDLPGGEWLLLFHSHLLSLSYGMLPDYRFLCLLLKRCMLDVRQQSKFYSTVEIPAKNISIESSMLKLAPQVFDVYCLEEFTKNLIRQSHDTSALNVEDMEKVNVPSYVRLSACSAYYFSNLPYPASSRLRALEQTGIHFCQEASHSPTNPPDVLISREAVQEPKQPLTIHLVVQTQINPIKKKTHDAKTDELRLPPPDEAAVPTNDPATQSPGERVPAAPSTSTPSKLTNCTSDSPSPKSSIPSSKMACRTPLTALSDERSSKSATALTDSLFADAMIPPSCASYLFSYGGEWVQSLPSYIRHDHTTGSMSEWGEILDTSFSLNTGQQMRGLDDGNDSPGDASSSHRSTHQRHTCLSTSFAITKAARKVLMRRDALEFLLIRCAETEIIHETSSAKLTKGLFSPQHRIVSSPSVFMPRLQPLQWHSDFLSLSIPTDSILMCNSNFSTLPRAVHVPIEALSYIKSLLSSLPEGASLVFEGNGHDMYAVDKDEDALMRLAPEVSSIVARLSRKWSLSEQSALSLLQDFDNLVPDTYYVPGYWPSGCLSNLQRLYETGKALEHFLQDHEVSLHSTIPQYLWRARANHAKDKDLQFPSHANRTSAKEKCRLLRTTLEDFFHSLSKNLDFMGTTISTYNLESCLANWMMSHSCFAYGPLLLVDSDTTNNSELPTVASIVTVARKLYSAVSTYLSSLNSLHSLIDRTGKSNYARRLDLRFIRENFPDLSHFDSFQLHPPPNSADSMKEEVRTSDSLPHSDPLGLATAVAIRLGRLDTLTKVEVYYLSLAGVQVAWSTLQLMLNMSAQYWFQKRLPSFRFKNHTDVHEHLTPNFTFSPEAPIVFAKWAMESFFRNNYPMASSTDAAASENTHPIAAKGQESANNDIEDISLKTISNQKDPKRKKTSRELKNLAGYLQDPEPVKKGRVNARTGTKEPDRQRPLTRSSRNSNAAVSTRLGSSDSEMRKTDSASSVAPKDANRFSGAIPSMEKSPMGKKAPKTGASKGVSAAIDPTQRAHIGTKHTRASTDESTIKKPQACQVAESESKVVMKDQTSPLPTQNNQKNSNVIIDATPKDEKEEKETLRNIIFVYLCLKHCLVYLTQISEIVTILLSSEEVRRQHDSIVSSVATPSPLSTNPNAQDLPEVGIPTPSPNSLPISTDYLHQGVHSFSFIAKRTMCCDSLSPILSDTLVRCYASFHGYIWDEADHLWTTGSIHDDTSSLRRCVQEVYSFVSISLLDGTFLDSFSQLFDSTYSTRVFDSYQTLFALLMEKRPNLDTLVSEKLSSLEAETNKRNSIDMETMFWIRNAASTLLQENKQDAVVSSPMGIELESVISSWHILDLNSVAGGKYGPNQDSDSNLTTREENDCFLDREDELLDHELDASISIGQAFGDLVSLRNLVQITNRERKLVSPEIFHWKSKKRKREEQHKASDSRTSNPYPTNKASTEGASYARTAARRQ